MHSELEAEERAEHEEWLRERREQMDDLAGRSARFPSGWWILPGVVLFVVLMVAAAAFAGIPDGRPVFKWTDPTQWDNGDALTPAQITGAMLSCAATTGAPLTARASSQPFTFPTQLVPGGWSCTVAVYAKKTATDTEVLGAASAPVSFTVPQARPRAATAVSAE